MSTNKIDPQDPTAGADLAGYEAYMHEHIRSRAAAQIGFWRAVRLPALLVPLLSVGVLDFLGQVPTGWRGLMYGLTLMPGVLAVWLTLKSGSRTPMSFAEWKHAQELRAAVLGLDGPHAQNGRLLSALARHHGFKIPVLSESERHRALGFVEVMQQASYPDLADLSPAEFEAARSNLQAHLAKRLEN